MVSSSRILSTIRALSYVERFGVRTGLRIYGQTRQRSRCISLAVPGYPEPVLLRTRTSDVQTFGQVFVAGEYDFPIPGPSPRLIIDAGAYVGYSTVFFARKNPGAVVIAIEPAEENFRLLVRNTSAYPNVRTIHGGLWNRKTRLRLGNPDGLHWSFCVGEADGETGDDRPHPVLVEAFTMPEVLEMAGGGPIDVLKLDIEGAEKVLFEEGCEHWLDQVRVVMIEMHDRLQPGCSQSFYRAIAGHDFSQLVKGENVAVFLDRGGRTD
jgi:FkbM family methyltransferase